MSVAQSSTDTYFSHGNNKSYSEHCGNPGVFLFLICLRQREKKNTIHFGVVKKKNPTQIKQPKHPSEQKKHTQVAKSNMWNTMALKANEGKVKQLVGFLSAP